MACKSDSACCNTAPNPELSSEQKTKSSCCNAPPKTQAAATQKNVHQGKLQFRVEGLCCAEEVSILRRVVGPLVGGEQHLAFDLLNTRMIVRDSAPSAPADGIIKAIRKTGMKAALYQKAESDNARLRQHTALRNWTATSGAFLVLAIICSAMPQLVAPSLTKWLYVAAIASGVRFVAPKAFYAAKTMRPDMNLLMAIAIAGALGIGEFFEGATVAFLFSLSLILESWSVGRARKAVEKLMDLSPPTLRKRETDGSESTIPVNKAELGTVFVVAAGERVALDGQVISGISSVDQAPITGESTPTLKEKGSEVFAGTINGEADLVIKATKTVQNTVLARITAMVSEAQGRRANAEQWVEKFAKIYTPAVMLLALAVALVPPLAFAMNWEDWFYRALVLLVIACPCALVISTPVSIVAGLTSAARNGILIKGGIYLELPAKLKAMALDKTGTITSGKPRVTHIIPIAAQDEDDLLTYAAALEARSAHPLAAPILAAAKMRGLEATPAENIELVAGRGQVGRIGGENAWLGSPRYLLERGASTACLAAQITKLEEDGATVVCIGKEQQVLGLIALQDTPRENAEATIRELHQLGLEKLVMLTGDNAAAAHKIATSVGIDAVHANLLPQDKLALIDKLSESHAVTAMIGDGVNDAPAMARADFGIAMGAIGSDAAIETADIALMNDDFNKLPWLIRHSRRTMGIIRQNITFAFVVKATLVVLTALGFSSLWAAILGDVGATLLVTANALRLLSPQNQDN
ncbi:heavy metal translocating P-type ATPase [Polycladidibacter hongkongensis]|uniref:heavy metal translocating P-type ATPase n=1 Tax=Polycladidibacter hongkongensis TaxID=1647556 RepID=UPI0008305266|nr:cation-translocating P-type ATPase [Pseudovibrio hongkongensis]